MEHVLLALQQSGGKEQTEGSVVMKCFYPLVEETAVVIR